MWVIIKSFFGGTFAKLGEWLGILGGIAAIAATIFLQGKKDEAANEAQAQAKAEGKANEIVDANKTRPDGAALNELQSDWSR